MNKDYGELIEYLDKKFLSVNEKFDKVFITLESKANKKEVNEKFERIEKKLALLIDLIDRLTKAIEIYHHEQVALALKLID